MSHVRQQIREAVQEELADITAFNGRVYKNRTIPHVTLPDATVYLKEEEHDHDLDVMGGDEQIRVLTVEIEIRARKTTTLDDEIDDLCVEVEKAIAAAGTFDDLLKQALSYNGTTIEMESETETETGLATIEYEAWYRVSAADPETAVA